MIANYTSADISDQTGKTFFITGANTGIGFEVAKAIAGKGGRVLLGCRDVQKGRDAVARIGVVRREADAYLVEIDLADLASIARAAEEVAREPRLDVLVNNAGVLANQRVLTKDGFESQFGVNHLGHFALAGHLMPMLLETPNARIVSTSSIGHRLGNGDLFWDDIDAERSYDPQTRYYASKLANLLFMYELDRRLRARGASTIAVAAHPGASHTDLDRHTTGWFSLIYKAMRPLMNSAEQGAWPSELAATHPDVEGGQYFGPGRLWELNGPARQVDSSVASKDPDKARRLWDLSIRKTGVDPGL